VKRRHQTPLRQVGASPQRSGHPVHQFGKRRNGFRAVSRQQKEHVFHVLHTEENEIPERLDRKNHVP